MRPTIYITKTRPTIYKPRVQSVPVEPKTTDGRRDAEDAEKTND